MRYALRRKFQRRELAELPVATDGRRLVENSPLDRYWGTGSDGSGLNRLGELLMKLRAELMSKNV